MTNVVIDICRTKKKGGGGSRFPIARKKASAASQPEFLRAYDGDFVEEGRGLPTKAKEGTLGFVGLP